MGSINEKDFIDELVFCLKEEDVVKAKALLQFASDANVDAALQKTALLELAKGPDRVVFQLLEFLTKIEISDQEVRDGLYDLILDKAYGNTDLVIEYITNNEKATRIQFIRAAGDLYLSDTANALAGVITSESDPEILSAAITALGIFRRDDSLDAFGTLAAHPDLEVRKSAIFAVAAHGSKEAVDKLLEFLGDDEKTNKLTVEALSDMQDIYALDKLTRLLSSSVTNVRDTAIDQ
ncbi:MAG TPA: response regulator, partial [Desulfobacteraceae bacterium]|nr:response regulator [Desulfobacteraceae bacterium]